MCVFFVKCLKVDGFENEYPQQQQQQQQERTKHQFGRGHRLKHVMCDTFKIGSGVEQFSEVGSTNPGLAIY